MHTKEREVEQVPILPARSPAPLVNLPITENAVDTLISRRCLPSDSGAARCYVALDISQGRVATTGCLSPHTAREHADTCEKLDGPGLVDPHRPAGLALQTVRDLEVD